MECLQQGALIRYSSLAEGWLHYMDDTFAKLNEYKVGASPSILTLEGQTSSSPEPEINSILAFLHVCEHIKDDGSNKFTIYPNPTLKD